MGGVITDRDALLLQTPEAIKARFNIDVLVNTRAEAIDRTAHTVTDLATGAARRLHYDRLVLAPGATPVRPSIPGIEWALTLRNVEDADALAAAAQQARTDAVTGGGFIRSRGRREPRSQGPAGGAGGGHRPSPGTARPRDGHTCATRCARPGSTCTWGARSPPSVTTT